MDYTYRLATVTCSKHAAITLVLDVFMLESELGFVSFLIFSLHSCFWMGLSIIIYVTVYAQCLLHSLIFYLIFLLIFHLFVLLSYLRSFLLLIFSLFKCWNLAFLFTHNLRLGFLLILSAFSNYLLNYAQL